MPAAHRVTIRSAPPRYLLRGRVASRGGPPARHPRFRRRATIPVAGADPPRYLARGASDPDNPGYTRYPRHALRREPRGPHPRPARRARHRQRTLRRRPRAGRVGGAPPAGSTTPRLADLPPQATRTTQPATRRRTTTRPPRPPARTPRLTSHPPRDGLGRAVATTRMRHASTLSV
jgi:hypothetical protein